MNYRARIVLTVSMHTELGAFLIDGSLKTILNNVIAVLLTLQRSCSLITHTDNCVSIKLVHSNKPQSHQSTYRRNVNSNKNPDILCPINIILNQKSISEFINDLSFSHVVFETTSFLKVSAQLTIVGNVVKELLHKKKSGISRYLNSLLHVSFYFPWKLGLMKSTSTLCVLYLAT